MFKIKPEYIGNIISKGNSTYNLTRNMTQQQMEFIKKMVCDEFIEYVEDEKKIMYNNIKKSENNESNSSKKSGK